MTPILFVHGFPFDHFLWRHQLEALSRWPCVAPDLRGAGGATPMPPYSMATYADDLIALLDRSRIAEAVVCGLSMGGYIAFELLRRFPKRVRAVVLCNTKAEADSAEAKQGRDRLAARAQDAGARAVATELVPKLLARATQEQRPDIARAVTEMIERQPVPGIVGALGALRDRPDSRALLPQIGVPALVVAGDDDQIAPAQGMREMARAIPGAHFVLIPMAGHMTPLEAPVALSAALADFLERVG